MTKLPPAVGHKNEDGSKYYTINDVRIDPDGKGNFTDGNRVGSLKSFKEQLVNYSPEEELTGCETTRMANSGAVVYSPWDTVSPALLLKHLQDNYHCIPAGFEDVLNNIYDAYGLSQETPAEIAAEYSNQVEGLASRAQARAEIGDKF